MKQMRMAASLRRCSLAVTAAAFVGLAAPALSQEPSAEHLSAARAALDAIDATDQFDAILPNAAQQLKTSLIQTAPNLVDVISVTVDETALSMAGRRADLEREAAAIYAKNFTIDELNAIRSFYESEAGQALLSKGPIVTRELLQAAEVWSNGINRDLSTATEEALQATVGETPSEGSEGDNQ